MELSVDLNMILQKLLPSIIELSDYFSAARDAHINHGGIKSTAPDHFDKEVQDAPDTK